jgi:hypothetical protein
MILKYLKEESYKKLKTATNNIFTRVTKISTLAEILNHYFKRELLTLIALYHFTFYFQRTIEPS